MTTETTSIETPPISGDVYPSRLRSEPQFLDRQDPVVYGDVDDGPLSREQLGQFERDGFLLLPAYLSDQDVTACWDELQSLCDNDDIKQRAEAIIEPDNSELRSLFGVHKPQISSLFAELAADERLATIATQLLGGDVYIHQSRVNLKPAFSGKEFYWHSDFETWHVEDGMPRMRAVSCSILLSENYQFNGPLMLIPGSHRQFVACVGETPENHYQMSLRRQEYGVPDHDSLALMAHENGIASSVGPAGTVVFFDCNTMHGSNGNITPFPRTNAFYVYNSIENSLVAPYCGKKPRPDYIAAREARETIVPRRVDLPSLVQ